MDDLPVDTSLINRIYRIAQIHPDRIAIVSDGSQFTYATFARFISLMRIYFEEVLPGRHGAAVIIVTDLLAAWFVMLGLRAAGLTTICVRQYDQVKGLNIPDLRCVVVLGVEAMDQVIAAARADGIAVVVVSPDIYENLPAHPLPAPDLDPAAIGGHILCTSGTTGRYKKVLLSPDVVAGALQHALPWLQGPDDVSHAFNLGLWTIMGYTTGASMWWAGAKLVVDNRPDLLAHFLEHDVNTTFMMPAMLREFLAENASAKRDLSRLKIYTGGAFLPLSLAREAARQIPTPITVYYGSTECLGVLHQAVIEDEDNRWLTVADGREVVIRDEDGRRCGRNEEGELGIKLREFDARGYLDDEETTRRFFRDDYFFPGDMAVQRDDGRIQILGRTSDVVNISGVKVAVAPIEQRIQNELGVEDVCVFSGLDAEGRENIAIAIQSPHDLEPAQLELIRNQFPEFEVAKFLVLREFPRAAQGMRKVQRPDLRRMAFGG